MSVSYGGSSITFEDGSIVSSGSQGFKNKIINGAMTIDQRNNGSSYSAIDSTYGLDRWKLASYDSSAQTGKYTVIQSSTAPAGFTNSMLITSSAATTINASSIYWIGQMIEGFNTADLDFGIATAKTITVSFWVRSSLTGTFGGAISNSAANRSYPFSYTINSANTFEYKTVTITGDTSGTWLTTNGIGIRIFFNLGSGTTYQGTANAWAAGQFTSVTGTTSLLATSGATLYIAGVQLEKGTTASTFEFRSYQKELMLCFRYFWRTTGGYGIPSIGAGLCISSTNARIHIQNLARMRSTPSYTYSGNLYLLQNNANGVLVTSIGNTYAGLDSSMLEFTTASGLTQGDGTLVCIDNSISYYFQASAEL